jgi:hypothetical protein
MLQVFAGFASRGRGQKILKFCSQKPTADTLRRGSPSRVHQVQLCDARAQIEEIIEQELCELPDVRVVEVLHNSKWPSSSHAGFQVLLVSAIFAFPCNNQDNISLVAVHGWKSNL